MKHLLTILLFFSSLLCYGQSSKLFTADGELSSSLINKIYQDHNGMIWIATEDGLNRYDGSKFTIYKHEPDNEYSLCHNYVKTLFEDSKGNLFIGTYNGIQLYDPETDSFTSRARWETGEIFESNVITILERRNGEIWLSGNNLCSLTIQDKKLITHKLNLSIPTSMVDYMIEDKNQCIWISKGEDGIYKLDANNQDYQFLQDEKGISVVNLCEGPNGEIFAGTMGKGLLKYDKRSNKFITIPYKNNQKLPIKALYTSNQSELYIGTDGKGVKVLNYRTQHINDYYFDNSYFDSRTSKVHSILKDNSGNFWLAIYQKGVLMIPAQPNSFKYLGYKSINHNIIGSNCITSICQDHNGILWVGTDNDGIYSITNELQKKNHYAITDKSVSVPSTVFRLYEDSKYNLWVGSFINGMGKLNRQTGECEYLHDFWDKNGNKVLRVYDFVEDNKQRLWIATMGAGLFYYDLNINQLSYNIQANQNTNDWISCLLYSSDNKLYTGTYDGVSCIDLNTADFKTEKFLQGHIIQSLYEDVNGQIWIGSSDGLSCWSPKTQKVLTTYTISDGLPSNAISAIQGDNQGYLWISTNAGISQFHLNSHLFINYYVSDGLQGNEFSKNTSFKDHNGTIWFGGTNGITYFNPQEIINPAKKWNIRITDFYLYDKPVRKGMLSGNKEIINTSVFEAKEFHLAHYDNTFSIEFSTLEMNKPERLTYYYSMDNDLWIKLPQGVNRVSFGNLEPGKHHFQVKARDYMLESETKSIIIDISPAWWASWWAKFVYTILILVIIYIIVVQVRHRYRTKQEMLQHIHQEQINEAKLQFFTNISHEIRTPMSLIISPLQKLMANDADSARQKAYKTIYRNAERILRLVNQLMDIRKIDKGQMSLIFHQTEIISFINELCETFMQQAVQRNIPLTFHHEGIDSLEIWIDTANFDKIILNLLSNAFKFTPDGGKIDIYLHTGTNDTISGPLRQYVEIIIADTGIGINEKDREHIFERFYQIRNSQNSSQGTGIGLHLTHSLVELHHGSIKVDSNPNEISGCRFIIRIPLGSAHLHTEEMDTANTGKMPQYPQRNSTITIPSSPDESEKSRSKTKYRILIVEDDEEIRHYIRIELSTDFHIIESSNGREALDIAFRQTPDLIISDVMMPEMDGLTLCQKIKRNINLNHIPVILLTAKTREEDNIEGLVNGADAYLTKPFNIEILRKTAINLIRGREQLRNAFSGQQTHEDKLQKIDAQSPDDKLMERIMKVINDNLSNPNLTIELITTEVGISRVHLHRKLKELTNQTTRDFIRNTRLKQAAILLSEKKHTVSEVATLTGFTNPNNFSTAFKELFGMAPTAYAEQHLKEKE